MPQSAEVTPTAQDRSRRVGLPSVALCRRDYVALYRRDYVATKLFAVRFDFVKLSSVTVVPSLRLNTVLAPT